MAFFHFSIFPMFHCGDFISLGGEVFLMNRSLLTDEGPFKDQTRKASKRGGERPIGPRNDCHKYCHVVFLMAWSHAKILEGYRGIEW